MNTRKGFKTILLGATMSVAIVACTDQQLMQTVNSAGEVLSASSGGTGLSLSNDEVIKGLKEALSVGTDNAASLGSKADGFLKNPKIHIPFPEDAIKVKNTVEDLGLKPQVDKFVTALNRSAEEAAKSAGPIFLDAITTMSIQDGMNILKGDKNAATNYLKSKTYSALYDRFKPKVNAATSKMKVADNWQPLAKAYNTATMLTGGQQVDPDLENYVTTRAVDGIFTLLADEEQKIRENPAARVTDLLKKVFATQD
jgi:hypothetical protein